MVAELFGVVVIKLKVFVCLQGVRIKEVSEGRPCDNCPELCPGFIPHSWRYVVL